MVRKGRTDGKGGESSRSREAGRVSGGERGSQQGGVQQQGGQHQGGRGPNPQSQQQGGQHQGGRGSNPQSQQGGGGRVSQERDFQQQGGQRQGGTGSNPQSQQGGGGSGQQPPQRYQQQYGGPQEHHVKGRESGGPVYQGDQGGYGGGSFTGPPQRQSVPNQHQETSRTYQAVSSTGPPQRQSVPDLHQATSNQAVSSQPTRSEANPTQMLEPNVLAQQFEQGAPSQAVKPIPSSSKAREIPTRPNQGQMGTPCKVKANHFFVKFPEKDLHQYNVTITPKVKSRGFNRAVMKQLVDLYRYSHLGGRLPAYDGRESLYTAGPLPFSSEKFTITPPDEEEGARGKRREKNEFTVVIKEAEGHPDLHHLKSFLNRKLVDYPKEAVQALDIALRQQPTSRYTPVAGSFYSPDIGKKSDDSPDIQSLDDFLESWRGFYQSIRPTQNGLSLNMDMSSTAFIKASSVIEVVQYLLKRNNLSRPLSDADRGKIKKALRGVKVEVTHRGNMRLKYRISGLTAMVTEELTFSVDGRTQSVVEYFRETYKVDIQYPELPCLQVGNSDKPKYLPMEVCKIVEGQRYSKRLNETQITALLKVACKPPREREEDILRIRDLNNYKEDPYAKEFGIEEIRTSMASFDARVLHPPLLKYLDESGREVTCEPEHGKWNMLNMKMINGGAVNNWICINFSTRVANYEARIFCQKLARKCIESGIVFKENPVLSPFDAKDIEEVETLYDEATKLTKGKNIDLLIAILPYKDVSLYGKLKRICETKLGIVSQCCLAKNVRNVSMQYMASVALKINVKVGGRNTVLFPALSTKLRGAATIIFGADVTHPHPGDDSSPSIAAVVASQDWPEVTKYTGLVCAQAPRKEVIQDLYKVGKDPEKRVVHGGMIRELLIAFYQPTGHKPGRIIFYRDGVGEGQFNEVLRYELDAIHKACASLQEGYEPLVTFVVVQKRHHTRLFADNYNDKESVDKSGNILPGTVVDSDICHPREFDFYLCSHAGIQGTSRPAHYHVLFDGNNVTADALQSLTNDLCYTYARCTRSVSIVPPVYYAHLLAARARLYIEPDASDSGSMAGGSMPGVMKKLPELHQNLKHPKHAMFYC